MFQNIGVTHSRHRTAADGFTPNGCGCVARRVGDLALKTVHAVLYGGNISVFLIVRAVDVVNVVDWSVIDVTIKIY